MALPTKRGRGGRRPGRRILVVCEGQRDELHYLRRARAALGLSRANVLIETAQGGSPASVVQAAVERADELRKPRAEIAIDEAWVVFDTEHAHSGADTAVDAARTAAIRSALSNPCFELWLLLHQRQHAAPMTAAQAKHCCRRLLDSNRKPLDFDDARLGEPWEAAAGRASKGRHLIAKEEGLSDVPAEKVVLRRGPSTNFDELLEAMNAARPGAQVPRG